MGAFFTLGEKKDRPGVYTRHENYGTPIEAGAADGVCAAIIRSNCGPLDKAVLLESISDIDKIYKYKKGNEKDNNDENNVAPDTTDVLYEMFYGGAKSIYVARLSGDINDVAAYKTAFELLEPFRWNVIGIDTEDTGVQENVQKLLNEMYEDGSFVMGVLGAQTGELFSKRLTNANAFDDYKIVYVGSGFIGSDGKVREGHLAAARVAGMIAGTPSNQSITHKAIAGATALTENLTNAQHTEAIQNGMLTFSVSAGGACWVECGVNTLNSESTGGDIDEGWKKIKRTKIRFELMQRINDTVENLIGKINNDPDGRATIIQAAQGVCNSMVNEKKLLAGAKVILDEANKPEGESAWFLIFADDIDSLEKMYFTFKFRFAPEDEEAAEEEVPADEPQDQEV